MKCPICKGNLKVEATVCTETNKLMTIPNIPTGLYTCENCDIYRKKFKVFQKKCSHIWGTTLYTFNFCTKCYTKKSK